MGNMTWIATCWQQKSLGDGKISAYTSCPLTPCIQHKRKPLTLNKAKSHVMVTATLLSDDTESEKRAKLMKNC